MAAVAGRARGALAAGDAPMAERALRALGAMTGELWRERCPWPVRACCSAPAVLALAMLPNNVCKSSACEHDS